METTGGTVEAAAGAPVHAGSMIEGRGLKMITMHMVVAEAPGTMVVEMNADMIVMTDEDIVGETMIEPPALLAVGEAPLATGTEVLSERVVQREELRLNSGIESGRSYSIPIMGMLMDTSSDV